MINNACCLICAPIRSILLLTHSMALCSMYCKSLFLNKSPFFLLRAPTAHSVGFSSYQCGSMSKSSSLSLSLPSFTHSEDIVGEAVKRGLLNWVDGEGREGGSGNSRSVVYSTLLHSSMCRTFGCCTVMMTWEGRGTYNCTEEYESGA